MQDWQCTGWLNGWPTWLGGKGDEWLHCCVVHDQAYETGIVSLWTHVELGRCVAGTAGGLIVGGLMAVATIVWWGHAHKNKAGRRR